jgi:parallel beta-helix repeat protein
VNADRNHIEDSELIRGPVELRASTGNELNTNRIVGSLRIAEASAGNELSSNRIVGSLWIAEASTGNTLESNEVLAGVRGIDVSGGSDRNRLVRNDILGSLESGIRLAQSSGVAVRGNSVGLSGENGIDVEHSNSALVTANESSDNSYTGILALTAPGTTIERNITDRNGEFGIYAGPDISVAGNSASFNGAGGIFGEPGVTDAGGNRAFGNRGPVQCLNVFCK